MEGLMRLVWPFFVGEWILRNKIGVKDQGNWFNLTGF